MKKLTALLLIVVLFLTACQTSTIVAALDAVVAAAEIALPLAGAAAGLPPQVSAAIGQYLRLVNLAADQATLILAGPGTAAEKSAAVVAAFSELAAGCGCLPAGTPQLVVSAIGAVARAIARFLAQLATPAGFTAANAPVIKVSRADRSALAKIRARAEANLENLEILRESGR